MFRYLNNIFIKYETKLIITIIVILIFLIYFILFNLYGEKVLFNDGFGFAGNTYAQTAQDYYNLFYNRQLSSKLIRRTLHSFIIFTFFKIFNIPITDYNLLNAFAILNIILILASLYCLYKISILLRYNKYQLLVAIIGMFLNFPILKLGYFYTTLSDFMTFFLSIFLLYAYLKNNIYLMVILTIFSAFSHHSVFYISLILVIFFNKDIFHIKKSNNKTINKIAFFISLVISFALLSIINFLYFSGRYRFYETLTTPTYSIVIFNAILLFVIYLFTLYYILNPIFLYFYTYLIKNKSLKILKIKYLILGIVLYLCVTMFQNYFSFQESRSSVFRIGQMVTNSIHLPIKHLISHIIYFGPIIFIIIYNYKKMVLFANNNGGLGLLLVLLFIGIFSFNTESRQLIAGLPFFVCFAVKTLNNCDKKFITIFLIMSLFASKFWLPINTDWLEGNYGLRYNVKYFMNFGPWLLTKFYLLQLIFIIPMGIYMFKKVK